MKYVLTGNPSMMMAVFPSTNGQQQSYRQMWFPEHPDKVFITSDNLLSLQGCILASRVRALLRAELLPDADWAQYDEHIGIFCTKYEFAATLGRAPLISLNPSQLKQLLLHAMVDHLALAAWQHPRNYSIVAKTAQIETTIPRLSCLSETVVAPSIYAQLKRALVEKNLSLNVILPILQGIENMSEAEYLNAIKDAGDLSGDYKRLLEQKKTLRKYLEQYSDSLFEWADEAERDATFEVAIELKPAQDNNLNSMPLLQKNLTSMPIEHHWTHFPTMSDEELSVLLERPEAASHSHTVQERVRRAIQRGLLDGDHNTVVVYCGITEPHSLRWRVGNQQLPTNVVHPWTTSLAQAQHDATIHGNYGVVLKARVPISSILHATHFYGGDGHKVYCLHMNETHPVEFFSGYAENNEFPKPHLPNHEV